MKHSTRKLTSSLLSAFLAVIMVALPVVGIIPTSAMTAAEAFPDWLTDGWTLDTSSGENVLKGNSASMNLLWGNGSTDCMYLEFDIYIDSVNSTVDGSIGSAYKMTNGTQYFFEYNTVAKVVRIRRIGTQDQTLVGKSMTLASGEWHHYKVVLEDNNMQWYLNGELLYTITDTKSDPLTSGQWYIQGYNTSVRLKNIKLYDAVDDAYPEWNKGSSWSVEQVDGENILTSDDSVAVAQLPTKEAVTQNALSLDMSMLENRSSVDGNMGVSFTFADAQKYFFEYNTVLKVVRVRRIISGASTTVGAEKSFEFAEGDWHKMKIVIADNAILWTIDGNTMYELDNTYGDDLSSGIWTVQGYNATTQVKNLKLFDDDPSPAPEVTSMDLEFTSADALTGFLATNGSISLGDGARDGALVYTLVGDNSYMQSPTIMTTSGDAYCANLTVKNTLFIRLKNNTDATQLRIYFKTPTVSRYTEEHSVLVDVTPNGGWESVYANFSACPDMTGYLRGFKIEPVGVTEGSIAIDAITFERENAIYDYAGEMTFCVADKDNETVTITGSLDAAYAGKKVNLYELAISNYTESVDGLTPMASTTADGTDFSFNFGLKNGKVTHLSTLFICTVETDDGEVKVSNRFQVENYRDFSENPYAFDLPDLTVHITDAQFGAVGDAFTDDTAKIQAAIDYVSAQGGGTVVVPGDDSFYGRRYIITNIKMKDNVELRIEEGAVLWQSPRVAEYQYDVVYGHDVVIPGVNWTHACSCHNLPLIQGNGVSNIRVTGGGIIRSVDTGGENLDSVSGSSIWTGCENRLHVIPVGFFQCENIEFTDITILRTNNYNFNLRDCENAYIGGLTIREVTCASGDGISCTIGTKHVLIDRFTFYSNDDAITLCSTYNDPRGLVWWHPNPGDDNCIDDITVIHSNIFGGHGITFIPWGTDAPDQSLQEIKNITVTDNVLSGTWSVGAWPDNPYYGKQPYDNSETNDYSPVKNVRILNNKYNSKSSLECIQGTNILTDCGITSASNFVNGDFERQNGEAGWTSGLSNWNWTGTVTSVADGENHVGKLTDIASLYEGLYLGAGEHTFTLTTNLLSGKGQIFVRNMETNQAIASLNIPEGETKELSLNFVTTTAAHLYIGAETTVAGELTIDNASITTKPITYPDTFEETFEKTIIPTFDYSSLNFKTQAGNSYIAYEGSAGSSFKLTLDENIGSFDLRFHARIQDVLSTVDGNVGVSFCRVDSNTQYFVEYNTVGHYILLRRYQNGVRSDLFHKSNVTLEDGVWYQWNLSYENGHILFYLDGEKIIDYTDASPLGAAILILTGYNTQLDFDNITLAEHGTLDLSEEIPVNAEVYALYFNGAGGTPTPSTQVVRVGETPNLSELQAITRKGYILKGWTDADGNMVNLNTFVMPAADTTLTAVWYDEDEIPDSIELKENIEKVQANLDQAVIDLTTAIANGDKALDDKITALNEALAAAKAALEKADADNKTALEGAIADGDAALDAAIKAVQKNLDDAKAELNTAIANGDKALDDKITALNEALASAKADLEKANADNKTALEGAIADGDAALDAAIKAVQKNLEDAKAELNTAIANGDKALDDKITALNEALASAKAALEKADADNRTALEGAIADGDAALDAAIKAVQKNLDDAKAELENMVAKQQTMNVVTCVISCVSLCGIGAFVVWYFIDRKKRIAQ